MSNGRGSAWKRLGAIAILVALFGSCTKYVQHGVSFDAADLENPPPPAIQVHADAAKPGKCKLEAFESIEVLPTTSLRDDEYAAFRITRTGSEGYSEEHGAAPLSNSSIPTASIVVNEQLERISEALRGLGLVVEPGARRVLQFQFGTQAMDIASFVDDSDFQVMYMHHYILELTNRKGRTLWLGTALSNRILQDSPAEGDDEVLTLMNAMLGELLDRICRTDHVLVPL